MLNRNGFDLWADGYDKSVHLAEEAGEYPFAGYKQVLGTIYRLIKGGDGKNVLDIGIGTGVLSQKLYKEGYSICGVDFSPRMIDIARQKMPDAVLIRHDITRGLPDFPPDKTFDYIVCTYAIHHLNEGQKIWLIRESVNRLAAGGRLLIGDVAFETEAEKERCRAQSGDRWDADEIYPVAATLKRVFTQLQFQKISFCAGVFSFSGQA